MEINGLPSGLKSLVDHLQNLDRPASIAELKQWLSEVDVDRTALAPFARFCDACYARNPVVSSAHFELLCICWKSGQCSTIHDHAGSACGVRVVEGELTETIFELVEGTLARPVRTNHHGEGCVCSSVDKDIHQIINLQDDHRELITLHIYSPPLAAMRSYTSVESMGLHETITT